MTNKRRAPSIGDPAPSETAAQTVAPRVAPRFGIAEWYGRSFVALTSAERSDFATFKAQKALRMKKDERRRLVELKRTQSSAASLTPRELSRLTVLEAKQSAEATGNKICPFKPTVAGPAICTKDGGVCSLRVYDKQDSGAVVPVAGERSGIRATCPYRFHEADTVFEWVGEEMLGTPTPRRVGEVGFIESSGTVDGEDGKDVGRLDMILVDDTKPSDYPLPWTALEIQAVYFSGKEMATEFTGVDQDVASGGSGMIWPTETRRPDYRSSGVKRLMPQLQIKVPTLRRWGKKMAVVVDRSFMNSIGKMENVSELSNSDVVWFIVDFVPSHDGRTFKLVRGELIYTTLDEAVRGLTGGKPVSMKAFESKLRERLTSTDIDDSILQ